MAILKHSKDGYDASLAQRTLGERERSSETPAGAGGATDACGDATLRLLEELGLADDKAAIGAGRTSSSGSSGGFNAAASDEEDTSGSAPPPALAPGAAAGQQRVAGSRGGAGGVDDVLRALLGGGGSGVLGDRPAAPAKLSSVQRRTCELRDRAAQLLEELGAGRGAGQAGAADEGLCALLSDLSRHVELLQRGNNSLRDAAAELRRNSREREEGPHVACAACAGSGACAQSREGPAIETTTGASKDAAAAASVAGVEWQARLEALKQQHEGAIRSLQLDLDEARRRVEAADARAQQERASASSRDTVGAEAAAEAQLRGLHAQLAAAEAASQQQAAQLAAALERQAELGAAAAAEAAAARAAREAEAGAIAELSAAEARAAVAAAAARADAEADAESRVAVAEGAAAAAAAHLRELEGLHQSAELQLQAAQQSLGAGAAASAAESAAALAAAEAAAADLQRQLDAAAEGLAAAQLRLEEGGAQLEAQEAQLAGARSEVERWKAEAEQLRAAASSQGSQLGQQLAAAQAEAAEARACLEAARAAESAARADALAARQQAAAAERRVAAEAAAAADAAARERQARRNADEAQSDAARRAEGLEAKCASAQQQLEASWKEVGALKEQLHEARQQAAEAAGRAAAAEAAARQGGEALAAASAEAESLRAQLAEAGAQEQELRASAAADAARLEARAAAAEAQLEQQVASLQSDLAAAASDTAGARAQAAAAEAALAAAGARFEAQLAAIQADAGARVEEYRLRWRAEFERRRKLHDQVVELRGNIRVLARIRPLTTKEAADTAPGAAAAAGASPQRGPWAAAPAEAVQALDEERVAVALLAGADRGGLGGGAKEFEFDRVFGPADGQEQVFDEVSALVGSVLDGYNVCIMAYGQTGSGKTHTMEGPAEDPGVYTRALEQLFRGLAELSEHLCFEFAASVLEIYNEQLFDILSGNKDTGDRLDIKQAPDGSMHVPGLSADAVAGMADVGALLARGKANRCTFATNMNEHSSRSHLVLTVYVAATDLATGAVRRSKLHLIDLAGSERVSRSGAQGERLKEAAAINKSLAALGDVVQALQQQSAHVPYRNSKLTRLLEDSLGGSSKTLLVVNCSPAPASAGETKCSLEFASRARKVQLGPAKRAAATGGGGGSGGSDSCPSSPAQQGGGAWGGGAGSPVAGSPRALRGTLGTLSAKGSPLRQA